MKRTALFAARFLFLVALSLVFLPACGGGTAVGGSSPGIIWNPTSTAGGGGTPGPAGVLWIDPNSGSSTGFTPFIPSSDNITYSSPTVYIADNIHPLSTATSAPIIVQAESGFAGAINGYRSQQLGGGFGGGGFGGGLGGGGFTQPPPNAFLQGHGPLSMNARANCKHWALYHPGPMAETNPEGDNLAGRLTKTGITAPGAVEIVISGPGYPDFTSAANYVNTNFGNVVTDLQWTHFGTGYWTGGSEIYYWSVIFARNPGP
jgi:hypothetical protein